MREISLKKIFMSKKFISHDLAHILNVLIKSTNIVCDILNYKVG